MPEKLPNFNEENIKSEELGKDSAVEESEYHEHKESVESDEIADDLKLKELEEDFEQKKAEDLIIIRKKLEDLSNGEKIEGQGNQEVSEADKEKRDNIAEAMKEVDSFLKEADEIRKVDLGFVDRGRNLVIKLAQEQANGNPKDLLYRAVAKMTEATVIPIRNGLRSIEKNSGKVPDKKRNEVEDLLQKAEAETDPKKKIEYAEKASELFEELIDKAEETQDDNKKERGRLMGTADENNGDARREKTKAEKTLGRGGYGTNIKDSILGRYADRSRMLAEFVAVESGRIDNRDQSFKKRNEDRKKAFGKILSNI